MDEMKKYRRKERKHKGRKRMIKKDKIGVSNRNKMEGRDFLYSSWDKSTSLPFWWKYISLLLTKLIQILQSLSLSLPLSLVIYLVRLARAGNNRGHDKKLIAWLVNLQSTIRSYLQ